MKTTTTQRQKSEQRQAGSFIFNGKVIKTGLTFGDKLRIFAGCLILSACIVSGIILVAHLLW
jgi:hypothetical protein